MTDKTCIVMGTRPEFIKLSLLTKLFNKNDKENFFWIHTGQHFSEELYENHIKTLNLPLPKYNLGISGSPDYEQIGRLITSIATILEREKVKTLIVASGTNSSISAVIAAKKTNVSTIVSVESGMRTCEKDLPENDNRAVSDHLSDYLLCVNEEDKDNLLIKNSSLNMPVIKIQVKDKTVRLDEEDFISQLQLERVHQTRITVTGSTNIDVCKALDDKQLIPLKNDEEYILLTLHRQGNVDNQKNLVMIINQVTILALSMDTQVLFPCHPRTLKKLQEFKIKVPKLITMMKPQPLIEFLTLQKNAKLIITDSITAPVEANYFKVPCLVLRKSIEHTTPLSENVALARKNGDIVKIAKELLAKDRTSWTGTLYGTGDATKKIYKFLTEEGK